MMEQLIPKLSFPEFKEIWEKSNIKENTNQLNGYAFKGDDISSVTNGIRLIRGINITEGFIRNNKEIDRYFNGDISKLDKYKVQIGDLVIGMDGSKVGKNIALITEKNLNELLVQRVSRLRRKNSDINFIYQLINNYRFHNYVDKVNTSSGIPHISSKQIDEYKIYIPTIQEQTKIADFLGAVDKQLDILNTKKEKLNTYKKGVVQQLFSQQLRFKDDNGNDFPEWEEKTLGEVCKIYDGTHQTPNYVKYGIPFYSVEHVSANDFSNTKFISEEVYDKEIKKCKIEKGDVLMTRIGSIGVAKYIDWEAKASFYVSLALLKSLNDINGLFLTQFINSEIFQKEIWSKSIHVAFPKKINLGDIGKLKIIYPISEEQNKIADFLSAIDKQIKTVSSQIQKTEKYKKGLLQQMFV